MSYTYLPGDIDPETIHVTVSRPFREDLEAMVYQGKIIARSENKYVVISQAVAPVEPEVAGEAPVFKEAMHFKSYDAPFFLKGYHLCAQNADAAWQKQHSEPRPFPSILIDPQGKVIVAKPSLCDNCVFGLQRKVDGHCDGRLYTQLPHVEAA